MRKIHLLFLSILFTGTSVSAQDIGIGEIMSMLGGGLDSDRPGQAMTPNSAGILAFQVQSGLNYERFSSSNFSYNFTSSQTRIRLGLSPRLELNTSFEYTKHRYFLFGTENAFCGFTSPEIGLRYKFMKGKEWVPSVALQANLSFASDQGDFTQNQSGSSFYLLTRQSVKNFSITTNLGMKYHGNGLKEPKFLYVLNLGYQFSSKFSAFIEGFGSFSDQTLFADLGFAYRPMEYLQFDIAGGWLGQDNFSDPNWFIDVGFTWKLSVIKILAKKKMANMKNNGFKMNN